LPALLLSLGVTAMETPLAGLTEFTVRTYVVGGGGGVTLPPLPQAMRSRVRQVAIQSAGLMRGVTGLRVIDLRIMELVVMGLALPGAERTAAREGRCWGGWFGCDRSGAAIRVLSQSYNCGMGWGKASSA
jgi:hypothetical protein